MDWKISVGTAGGRSGGRAAEHSICVFAAETGRAAARVKFIPNAGRTTSGTAGSIPAHQAEQVWRNVLSILVGTG
jgi:hypothetical protein